MKKSETNYDVPPDDSTGKAVSSWNHMIRGLWRSPVGLLGVLITTTSITLLVIGVLADISGASFFDNPYAGVATYMILPGGMIFGLMLIPVSIYLRRKQWLQFGMDTAPLKLNLSDRKHQGFIVGFVILTVVNMTILVVVGYEGYHFTDSPYFCGMVCHQVMEPEYVAYQRSPHSRVVCVDCHIGPGAEWFVRAKISGLRQVKAVLTNNYSRPIPAPVHELRPARDTCEDCHWPEKFHGKKLKKFTEFSNDNQQEPEVQELALHIGGHNLETDKFEGIHWHVSKDVKVSYLATNRERTQIAKVRVKRPDGSTDEFVKNDIEVEEGEGQEWRTMDCIDCHNRPTHIYDMPEKVVDSGLSSRKINRDIIGIREDSLTVLTKDYSTREEAQSNMTNNLLALQKERNPEQADRYVQDIEKAGAYLVESYLGNVWPKMNVLWGTYKLHLGHQYADEGYGCWRCHDDEHENTSGETISQDCSLCHDDPE